MSDRVFIDKQTPTVFTALTAAEIRTREQEVGWKYALLELINRASQLNACAFCLDRHTHRALEAGASAQRLAVLPGWRDTDLFTSRERSALNLTGTVILLAEQHPADADYARARTTLSDDETALVIWAAITTNAFNRVSILSHHPIRRHRRTEHGPLEERHDCLFVETTDEVVEVTYPVAQSP